MKWAFILISSAVSAFAGWTLNPSVPGVTNLGALIASDVQERSYYFVHTNGDKHVILPYYSGVTDDLVDLNLTQGSMRRITAAAGRFSYQGVAYTNGWFYFSINYISPAGTFSGYNVEAGTTNIIASSYQLPSNYCDWGDDGWLYMGSYGYSGAQLERYNRNTDTFEQLGVIDTNNFTGLKSQYAFSLGADTRYCYVAIRGSETGTDGYYLGVYDSTTGVKTNFWWIQNDAMGNVYHGRTGGWYYLRTGTATNELGGANVWYALSNGVPNLIGTNSTFYTNVYFMSTATGDSWRGHVISEALTQTNDVGYNLDMGFAIPNSSNNVATIGYRTNNAAAYTYLSVSNFSLALANLRKVYPDGANLFILGRDYLPWIQYNPATRYVTVPGSVGSRNMYDALKIGSLWYPVGYDASTFEWNPALPWTYSPSVPDPYSASVNPHLLTLSMTTHEMYPCLGSDNNLYVCAYVTRAGSGAKFGRYDLTYGTNTSAWIYTTAAEGPNDMISCLGGTKMVFLTTGLPQLRLFNTWSSVVFGLYR